MLRDLILSHQIKSNKINTFFDSFFNSRIMLKVPTVRLRYAQI